MIGFLLLLPFLVIRFGLLSMLNREAVARAAFFPPRIKGEKTAYWVYQLANLAIFVALLGLKVVLAPPPLFFAGVAVYAAGTVLLAAAVAHFAAPTDGGIHTNGLYRFSRNPMYVAYFVFFIGCTLLTQSLPLLLFVLIFQIAAHWIILSEERWCISQFGHAYKTYMGQVRRYL